MPIVYPEVESDSLLADLLAWPATEGPINRIQIERSATGGGSGYANIGSVTLTSGALRYTFYDVNGAASDWYRWYYSNAGNTFPASGNRQYSTEIQPSDEGSGLICTLGDVKQDLGSTATGDDEAILSKIRQVTAEIHGYTGRQFVRSPASGTTTYTFDIARYTRTLWVPKGIAACAQVEVATQTGGAYSVVTAADWFLDPPDIERDPGWPATRVVISDAPTGSVPYFYPGKRTVRLTMAIGWATIPAEVQGIGIRATIAAFLSKDSGAGGAVGVGPSGSTFVLRHISPADRMTLDRYRVVPV